MFTCLTDLGTLNENSNTSDIVTDECNCYIIAANNITDAHGSNFSSRDYNNQPPPSYEDVMKHELITLDDGNNASVND